MNELDARGADLLQELARDPASDSWRQFDSLFYEVVWKYIRANHDKLAARVARYLGVQGVGASPILPDELDEVAHEATQLALRRVRENAARFDPRRGKPTLWVIGAAEFAYVDVVKTIASARRSDRLVFVPPDDLPDQKDPAGSPEEQVLRHLEDVETLQEAASHLTPKEFAAIRLVVTAGYSYAEAAKTIYGDATMTRQVDGLLARGKRKLAEAWRDRRPWPRPAGSGSNAPGRNES